MADSAIRNRYDFGFHSVDFSGMVYGFDLLLLFFLWRRFVYRNAVLYGPKLILYLALVALAVIGLIASQARAAILGLLVVSAAFVVITWLRYWKLRRPSYSTFLVTIMIFALVGIAFVHIWEKRAIDEADTINMISDLNFSGLPRTSIGLRLNLIGIAIPAIIKRPLFGWGNEGSEIVISRSELPEDAIKETGHFHNLILDMLVRHGLVVLATIVSLYIWFLRASRNAYDRGIMPSDIYSFIIGYFLYFLVVNQFDAYLLYGPGDIVNHSALAIAFVYILKNKKECSRGVTPESY
jgi:O-antigen ligase